MNKIKERILQILDDNALSVNRASKIFEMPQRTLNRQLNEQGSVSTELICAVYKNFPAVSLDWLLGGEGEMYKSQSHPPAIADAVEISPYYGNLPVTAGDIGIFSDSQELPDTYIGIPGVKAQFFFPVKGSSMEPEINEGDIVGVNRMENIDNIELSKTYMIVTHNERMIKHCMPHETDNTLVWCISPNFPPFTIKKEDILAMFNVVTRISNI